MHPVIETLPVPAGSCRFLMSSLDFGERGPQVGSGCRPASLASCPYHTGRAQGALCGPRHQLSAGRAGLEIYFPFIAEVVNAVGERVSERVLVCPLGGRSSLTEPRRGVVVGRACLHTDRGPDPTP